MEPADPWGPPLDREPQNCADQRVSGQLTCLRWELNMHSVQWEVPPACKGFKPVFRYQGGPMVRGPARTLLSGLTAGVLLILLSTSVGRSSAAVAPPDRIVAVGDVHGDFTDFCLILRRTQLVDEQNHWVGGSATLVQTGDLIDRGAQGRESMDLLMALQTEASKAGGNVVPLLGNHEVMNIVGDLRYVTQPNYAAFADSESEKRRKAGYDKYAAWAASRAESLAAIKQPGVPASEQQWMAEHPAGFLEYREAFGPNGKYGKWVRQHAAVAEIGGIIFLHGGISPGLTSMSLDQINKQVREEIENFDKTTEELISRKVILPFFTIREIALAVQLELLQQRSTKTGPDTEYQNRLVRLLDFSNWLCMRDEGPLWFRGYDGWSDEEGGQRISQILTAYNATHVVVAHTVQKSAHIRGRFRGTVFLIDTGMLSTYWAGGRASALEILKDGKIVAQYLDGQEVLFEKRNAASSDAPK
jgi:hypothetical protein